MLRNLKAEMARYDVSNIDLSILLKKSLKSIVNRLNCSSEFNRKEMYLIKKTYFPDIDLEYLFEFTEKVPSRKEVI